jgi:ABC-type Fe3+/spermidine/putrescine transport system ATPase subunit
MKRLEARGLQVDVAGQRLLQDIDLAIPERELHVLLGPSGCGKTTLLKTLAGLHPLKEGRILLDGEDISRWPPERRRLVMLHQENTLFPHLDVAENVGFGPRLRGRSARDTRDHVRDLLRLVNLEGFEHRRIHGLSGGERQRVMLARALAVEPLVLLLDEPFSALDRLLRQNLREDLRKILQRQGVTSLYVTHDQEEAFALGDRLLVMGQGRIVDDGPVADVFRTPSTTASARILGRHNLFRINDVQGQGLQTDLGPLPLEALTAEPGQVLMVREEEVEANPDPSGEAQVESVQFLGTRSLYRLRVGAATLHVERPGPPTLREGDLARIDWSRCKPHVYASSGQRQSQHP